MKFLRDLCSKVASVATSIVANISSSVRTAQKVAAGVSAMVASAVVSADPPAYMADLTTKLTEAQTVMTFFIGVAVVWAGYRMVRRVIK